MNKFWLYCALLILIFMGVGCIAVGHGIVEVDQEVTVSLIDPESLGPLSGVTVTLAAAELLKPEEDPATLLDRFSGGSAISDANGIARPIARFMTGCGGPVLFVGGAAFSIWNSCPGADATDWVTGSDWWVRSEKDDASQMIQATVVEGLRVTDSFFTLSVSEIGPPIAIDSFDDD